MPTPKSKIKAPKPSGTKKGPSARAFARANANASFKRAATSGAMSKASRIPERSAATKSLGGPKQMGAGIRGKVPARVPAKASNPALDLFGGVSKGVNDLVTGIRNVTNMGESPLSRAMKRK